MALDKIDLRILAALQDNARISISELANLVSLTATPCARRLQHLEEEGYIERYVAVLDQKRLGLPVDAFAEVRLTREGKAEMMEFESAVRHSPQILQCWAMSGRYDYLLHVAASDLESYNRFLREELLKLSCVDHVETSFALQRVLGHRALPLEHLSASASRKR
ncbi:MAG TPA: Lrp/AsnC family transcriptional regulator [Gammaproteobacteria bacterium]|nr:Lrp/AsnC family transcriptional regulator [Gammaproteobacteria bacterium]